MKAAIPQYMGDTQQAAPGHRFGMYFPMWNQNTWEVFEFPKQEHKSAKSEAIKKVLAFQPDDKKDRMHGLVQRQQAQALTLDDAVCSEYAVATAPFVTGMGYEHPLENGFAFLNPYGLPYLPGSSVKGVMRRAAEELVLDEVDCGFDMLDVWQLFGFDGNAVFLKDKDAVQRAFPSPERLRGWLKRILSADLKAKGLDEPDAFLDALPKNKPLHNEGALNFWDVFPQGNLAMDIMTPHHSAYFQGTASPHDSESPVPIPFLTVAPEAQFAFHVQCMRDVDCDWQAILKQCFEHAFDWLGFGAKTAVGYGAMAMDAVAVQSAEKASAKATEEARKAAMTPLDRDLEIWHNMDTNLRETNVSAWVHRMQEAESDDALRIATALQTYLQETGSWRVKKKGAKKERVRKVKAILQQHDCL